VSVLLTASPTSITAGGATTLTWSSTNADSCEGAGGGIGDTWPGTKATSGSQSIQEPYAPVAPSVTLTYTLTCRSVASGQSVSSSTMVLVCRKPAKSHGGGALDSLALLALLGGGAMRRFARASG
jgi:hypothetical protein